MFKETWGIKLKRNKKYTAKKKIERFKELDYYEVPVIQHIGKEGVLLVKEGSRVKKYEPLTKAEKIMTLPVHSPVSGTVEAILEKEVDGRMNKFIKIKNDYLEEEYNFTPSNNFIDAVKEIGLSGMGGASFPSYLKFKIAKDSKVKTLIVNGAECEPFLTCDFRQMEEKIDELLGGIKLLQKELDIKIAFISIEESEIGKLTILREIVENEPSIFIKEIPSIYPVGNEKLLLREVMGIELGEGELPNARGVLVSNVSTIISLYEGIIKKKPLIERVVTVSGKRLKTRGNFLIKIGTPISKILEELNLESENIVRGGPMNGRPFSKNEVITKGTNGLIKIKNKVQKSSPCIKCGKCVEVCGMGLMPVKLYELSKKGTFQKMAKKYSVHSCIKCGSCEFICPSKRPLMGAILEGITNSKEAV